MKRFEEHTVLFIPHSYLCQSSHIVCPLSLCPVGSVSLLGREPHQAVLRVGHRVSEDLLVIAAASGEHQDL